MSHPSPCCLCSQIAGREANDLIASLLPGEPYARRVMLDTPSFALIPSLGPLSPGHSLLCPRTHIRCFALLAEAPYAEYLGLKRSLRSAFERLYSAGVHLFEHGMAASGDRVPCSVEHAHLHLAPLPGRAALDAGGWTGFDGSREQLRAITQGREYLFYETPDGECRLRLAPPEGFESQYMRRLLGGGQWNWRDFPDAPAADLAWRRFVEAGAAA